MKSFEIWSRRTATTLLIQQAEPGDRPDDSLEVTIAITGRPTC